MDAKLLKKYVPMTETAFYILLSLLEENHGYQITQWVSDLTKGEVNIGPGTMYGSLGKFEKDGLIEATGQEDKRKYYIISDLGRELLRQEVHRIHRMESNIKELIDHEKL